MKPDPDALLQRALDTINPQCLTGDECGLFSITYSSGDSTDDNLWEEETIHYLLMITSGGLIVDHTGTGPTQTHNSDDRFSLFAVITLQRVFFVIGAQARDALIEVDVADIRLGTLITGLLLTNITDETSDSTYTLPAKMRSSSDSNAVFDYLTTEIVSNTPSTDETAITP